MLRTLTWPGRVLLVCGITLALMGMLAPGLIRDSAYVLDNPVNQRFLSFLSLRGLLDLRWRGAVYGPSTGPSLCVTLNKLGCSVELHQNLSPAQMAALVKRAADLDAHMAESEIEDAAKTCAIDIGNGVGFLVSSQTSEITDLIRTFDPVAGPIDPSLTRVMLTYEASKTYKWGQDLMSHHGVTLELVLGWFKLMLNLPVIPLVASPTLRVLITNHVLSALGLATATASLLLRRRVIASPV